MKSKPIFFGIVFLSLIQFSYGQATVGVDGSANQLANAIELMNTGKRQIVSAYISQAPRKIFGSYYIFDDWENKGVIHISDDKVYRLNNININVKDDRFESKVGKDSIFNFNANSVDYFVINNRKFKNIYISKFQEKRICEIVLEDKEFMILKIYVSDIKRNDPDPLMLKPNGDEFIVSSTYYIQKGSSLKKFKLGKKQILELFSDKDKLVDTWVKEHKLSYKKDEHLKKMYFKWKAL